MVTVVMGLSMMVVEVGLVVVVWGGYTEHGVRNRIVGVEDEKRFGGEYNIRILRILRIRILRIRILRTTKVCRDTFSVKPIWPTFVLWTHILIGSVSPFTMWSTETLLTFESP